MQVFSKAALGAYLSQHERCEHSLPFWSWGEDRRASVSSLESTRVDGQDREERSPPFIRPIASFFPKALRRVLPENPLNTDTSTLTLRHLHLHTHTLEERKHPSAKYASVKVCKSNVLMKNISPLYKFSLKGGGWDEQRQPKMQPFAEIVRVECTKCRRERDLPAVRATLCGDRACRVRKMQARVRFVRCARNPLRRSCVSSARNAGESAICPVRAQPSAEIVRVECAKCRRECDLPGARATLCGDRACRVREMQALATF